MGGSGMNRSLHQQAARIVNHGNDITATTSL